MKYSEIAKLSPLEMARWYLNDPSNRNMPDEAKVFSFMQMQPLLSHKDVEALFARVRRNEIN